MRACKLAFFSLIGCSCVDAFGVKQFAAAPYSCGVVSVSASFQESFDQSKDEFDRTKEAYHQRQVQLYVNEFCSLPRYRTLYGRNHNGDIGEWGFFEARRFYLDKNAQALDALEKLQNLDLPAHMLGDLAFTARDTVKQYTRERSFYLWRAQAVLDGLNSPTLSNLKEKYRKQVLDAQGDEDLSEEAIQEKVSLLIYASSKRTREKYDALLKLYTNIFGPKRTVAEERNFVRAKVLRNHDKVTLTEQQLEALVTQEIVAAYRRSRIKYNLIRRADRAILQLQTDMLQIYEDLCYLSLLSPDQDGCLPSCLRQFFRSLHPNCARKIDIAMIYRARRCES